MKKILFLTQVIFLSLCFFNANAQKKKSDQLSDETFTDFKFRSIGPAFMSGRIADIAIHPENQNIWYVAVGSGGVWKTENSGVSWTPVFDDQKSFSIGCITIDPVNPHTVWVGTGENVGGRHVGFGSGVYRSDDDGKSWKNMGLQRSEHISKIIVNPKNSDIIWVAAQGPLWSKGGERGIYKTTDGGKTWKKTLGDEEWTGATDIAIDPRNPDRLYAATWQRQRTIAAYLGSGPGTALYRSEDGGNTWNKLTSGLPKSDMGKIGLAISPQQPDVLYAAIELERRTGAVYKSTDRGESWKEMSKAVSGATGPHYYQELYASPYQFDKIYLVDVRMQISDDGGKTFHLMNEKFKHSDNHAIAFKKNDPNYLIVGTDGGLYETFDAEQNWHFINNLPITQFYKIALDDTEPFYQIYGGTQDNSTQRGVSRTDNVQGISNADWEVVLFADGHQPATEPGNPDIMYAEWQQGNLVRIDRSTGEIVYIQPQPEANEPLERHNWDSPILVSPHSPTRLYFGTQRVWRSDNRGDEWKAISGNLTKNQERMTLPVMDKKQSWDESWDLLAMSEYNTITSLTESPKQEGLIYAGTDDGIIQVTEDGGQNWRKILVNALPGVPATAFVNDIKADLFDANTVYVSLDNHKFGDFKPYFYKSTDKGKSWKLLTGNLEQPLLVWRMVQDNKNPNLLFLATEFGVYFTIDGGTKWIKLSGLPTISVRDLAIQKHENDLVAASFGRGIYILDDYSALRDITPQKLEQEALLFKPRNGWWYIEREPLGDSKKGYQGESYFIADNPPFGVQFTYYLKDDYESLKELRQKKEKDLKKNNLDIEFPGWEAVDKEMNQSKPKVWLTILDEKDNVIRKIKASTKKGIHRVAWDLRFASKEVIGLEKKKPTSDDEMPSRAFMVAPGKYKAYLSKEIDGKFTKLTEPVDFEVIPMRKGALKGADYKEVAAFWGKVADMRTALAAINQSISGSKNKIKAMKIALNRAASTSPELYQKLHDVETAVRTIDKELNGSPAKESIGENDINSISQRVFVAQMGTMNSTYGPTPTHKKSLEIAQDQYKEIKAKYEKIKNEVIPQLEKALIDVGAPYIEGQELPD